MIKSHTITSHTEGDYAYFRRLKVGQLDADAVTIPETLSLPELSDVNFPIPLADQQQLIYNAETGNWENSVYTPSLTLDDLSNVTAVGAIAGDLLVYTGEVWQYQTVSNAINEKIALTQLSDVTVSNIEANDGQFLYYDHVGGPQWRSKILDATDLPTNIPLANLADGAADGELLTFDGAEWTSTPAPTVDRQTIIWNQLGTQWTTGLLDLTDLGDVDVTDGPAINGHFLYFNDGTANWNSKALQTSDLPTGIPLANLGGGSADGQMITYNGVNWVVTPTPTVNGQTLVWDQTGTQWTVAIPTAVADWLTLTNITVSPNVGGMVYRNATDWVTSIAPTAEDDLLVWNHTLKQWIPQQFFASQLADVQASYNTGGILYARDQGGGNWLFVTSPTADITTQFLTWDNNTLNWGTEQVVFTGTLDHTTVGARLYWSNSGGGMLNLSTGSYTITAFYTYNRIEKQVRIEAELGYNVISASAGTPRLTLDWGVPSPFAWTSKYGIISGTNVTPRVADPLVNNEINVDFAVAPAGTGLKYMNFFLVARHL